MVLIKVADISNEARPMEVAEPWLDKLLQVCLFLAHSYFALLLTSYCSLDSYTN